MSTSSRLSENARSQSVGDELDPYEQWLAIPADRRPPTHYDLFGLRMLEEDPVLIRQAALERLAHVRKYQISQHGEKALRLLDEMSKAYVCLTDPALKAQYDRQFPAARREASADWPHSAQESWAVVESTYPRDGSTPSPMDEQPSPAPQSSVKPIASPVSNLLALAGLFRKLAFMTGSAGVLLTLVLIGRHEHPLTWMASLLLGALAASTLAALAALLQSAFDLERRMERRLDQIETFLGERPPD